MVDRCFWLHGLESKKVPWLYDHYGNKKKMSASVSWNHERDIAGDVAFPLFLMYCMIAPTIKKVQWMAGANTLLLASNLLSPIWSLVPAALAKQSCVHRWQSGSAKFQSIFLDQQSSSTTGSHLGSRLTSKWCQQPWCAECPQTTSWKLQKS